MVVNHKSFNKKLFADLLQKVKGKQTLTKFSKESNVSIAHISRMLNERLDSPPSPETIKKLIPVERNGVTYSDLMIAAGHQNQINIFQELIINDNSYTEVNKGTLLSDENQPLAGSSESSLLHFHEENIKYKSLCMSTILFNLSCCDLTWSITKGQSKNHYTNYFSIQLQNNYITYWTFDLKRPTSHLNNNMTPTSLNPGQVFETWGKLAATTQPKNSKYTMVTESEELYEVFIKYPPINLNLNISIMLVNTDKLTLIKEEYVSYCIDADKLALEELIVC